MPDPAPPIRVLHLHDRLASFQAHRAFGALTAGGGAKLGVSVEGPVPRRLADRLRRVRGADLVQCWDGRSLVLAALAGARRIVYSPQEWPSPAAVRWARAAMAYRDVHVVCPSVTLRRHLVARGVPPERCHVVRPGVDFSRLGRRRDPDARRRLGARPDDFLLYAPGESTRAANHRLAAWTTSILHVLDPGCRLLVDGRGPLADALVRLAGNLGQPGMVVPLDADDGPERAASAADAVLVTAADPVPALPIATCMAAALPVVAAVTSTVAELLEDRHSALLVGDPKARVLADRVLALREDAALRRRIADAARTEAFKLWPMTRFLDRWRQVYAQVAAGGAVVVAD